MLAAVGAAWALDIPVELIRAGIDLRHRSGRRALAVHAAGGSTVVVDDAHNASALRPLIAAIDHSPPPRAAPFSAGADRRDAET